MPWRGIIKKRLPPWLAQEIDRLTKQEASSLLEIRLYTGCAAMFIYPWGCKSVGETIGESGIQEVLAALSGYALFSCERQMAAGYIPLSGGHRAGICGRMTRETDGTWRMANVHSICVRIARRIAGSASGLYAYLTEQSGMPRSILLLGPPGCGKTTLLADAAAYLAEERGLRTAVVDEREELFPAGGEGKPIDVLSGCDKASGVMMILRTMSPQIIVCDEIGSAQDAAAIEEAARCGAAVLASAHAKDLNDARCRTALRRLIEGRIFDFYVLLGYMGAVKMIWNADGQCIREGNGDGQLGYCRHGDDCRQHDGLSAC